MAGNGDGVQSAKYSARTERQRREPFSQRPLAARRNAPAELVSTIGRPSQDEPAQKNERQNRVDDEKQEGGPDPPGRVNPQQPDYQGGPDRLGDIDAPAFGGRIRPESEIIPSS